MITPTGVTSAQYWDAIKNGNPTHVRMVFANQNITLDDSDIYLSNGVTVTDILNGDTDLVFGKAVSKQITVSLLNSNKLTDLKWTGEFTLEIGVDIGSPAVTYWVQVGIFSGEKPNNVTSDDVIDFTAYDRMKKFDCLADDFVKTLTYSKTVNQIYTALCSFVGLTSVSGDELPGIMSRSYASEPMTMEGYTCRDILAWIAEACGCYAKINATGNVQMVWFADNTAHSVTGDEEFSVESGDVNGGMIWDVADTYTWNQLDTLTWNDIGGYEDAYRIDQIMLKQVGSDLDINYPDARGGNVYSIVENPFLSVGSLLEINAYIKPIYDRMEAFGGYLPVQLDCVGDPCVEAGDIITIEVNGETISFPIFVRTLRWNSAINDSYDTTGNKNRAVYSSEEQRQKVLVNNEIKLSASRIIIEAVNEAMDAAGQTFISKTTTLQTADQIVTEAVSQSSTSADQTYIKKTTTLQTADQIINEAVSQAATSASNAYIAKTTTYQTAESIKAEAVKTSAQSIAPAFSTSVSYAVGDVVSYNGKVYKFTTAHPAGAWNSSHVSETNLRTASEGSYIAKTSTYQDASSIVSTAENYTDNKLTSYSTTSQTATAISQYVTNNAYGKVSGITITANGIEMTGSKYIKLNSGYIGIGYFSFSENGISWAKTVGNQSLIGTLNCYEDVGNLYYWNLNADAMDMVLSVDADKQIRIVSNSVIMRMIGGSSTFGDFEFKFNSANQPVLQWSANDVACCGDDTNIWHQVWAKQMYADGYNNRSSREIKRGITPIADDGDKIDELQPVTFIYKDDKQNIKHSGLIYEDTVEILPEICHDDGKVKSIDYVQLVPYLLKEIQSLRSRVKDLESA